MLESAQNFNEFPGILAQISTTEEGHWVQCLLKDGIRRMKI